MNKILEQIKQAFLDFWRKLTKAQKIIIGSGVGGTIIFLVIIITLTTRVNYEPLFTDLKTEDAAKISRKLEELGIDFRLAGNGTIIEVDSISKHKTRLDLASEGIIETGTSVGFGIFDKQSITSTEFDKQINLLRAIEGELENTINILKAVKKSEVTITPQSSSPFLDEKEAAKASIVIYLQEYSVLTEENVRGIMQLIASGVEGLSPDNVVVMDDTGNILSLDVSFGDEDVDVSDIEQLRTAREKNLEKKAVKMLSSLGSPENYRVQVSIDLDFDKETISKEEFSTPSAGGKALQEGLAISKQTASEKYEGSGGAPSEGVPGTSSNIPGYIGVESEKDQKKYEKNTNTTNYEVNKTQSSYEKAMGKIRKLNVSVLLNTKARSFGEDGLTSEMRIEFENIVKAAVGFDLARGDTINVSGIPFDDQIKAKREETEKAKRDQQRYIVFSIVGLIVFFVIVFIVATALRKIEERKFREKERKAVEELIPEFEEVAIGEQLNVEDQERLDKENTIKDLAKQKPEEVASLIRTWMMDD